MFNNQISNIANISSTLQSTAAASERVFEFLNFFWRFFMGELLQKQIMFSKNIECCREVIFDLRYLDITAYTGFAESTMISYDTRAFSPYISKIAIQ